PKRGRCPENIQGEAEYRPQNRRSKDPAGEGSSEASDQSAQARKAQSGTRQDESRTLAGRDGPRGDARPDAGNGTLGPRYYESNADPAIDRHRCRRWRHAAGAGPRTRAQAAARNRGIDSRSPVEPQHGSSRIRGADGPREDRKSTRLNSSH